MQTINYNGTGKWSVEEICARYLQYAAELGISPRTLSPIERTEGARHWVYPIMEQIIAGIEAGDLACIPIGIEFIEEDQRFAFGRILKPKTARALRRATLTPEQQSRILHRIFDMLKRGYVPHEYHEYSRLARRIGFSMSDIPATDTTNYFAAKYHQYFVDVAKSKSVGI